MWTGTYFTKEGTQKAEKHVKSRSSLFVIIEIQIKTIKCHDISAKTAEIENTTNTKCWRKHGAIGIFIHFRWQQISETNFGEQLVSTF